MPSAFTIEVEGLVEIQAAFKELDKRLAVELKKELLRAGEPVARSAKVFAKADISRMTEPWSNFRIGSLTGIVYIAPKQRGTRDQRKRRPNFAGLLMTRAMEPALAANESLVAGQVEQALDRVIKGVGF